VIPVPSGLHAALVVMYGENLGRKFDLRQPLTIGRGEEAEVQINQTSVSRLHARIEVREGQAVLSDLGSTNGTIVNDEEVREKRVLQHGDFVKVGRTVFKFLASQNIEASYHDAIYRLSTVDGLTGAHNRRFFDHAAQQEMARAKRHERALSLLLLDIDNFKALNDTAGHLAGDHVLRAFTNALLPSVRMEDTLARFGGEEFALLLPEMSLFQACLLAERLRSKIESTRFEFDGLHFQVTVSIGVVQCMPEDSFASFLSRADEKLYAAKAAGKNRVGA
jgi:two-component system, cell cycle response regulator